MGKKKRVEEKKEGPTSLFILRESNLIRRLTKFLGPILQSSISAENISDSFSSSNFGLFSTQTATDILLSVYYGQL
jgi:hypothetical protein